MLPDKSAKGQHKLADIVGVTKLIKVLTQPISRTQLLLSSLIFWLPCQFALADLQFKTRTDAVLWKVEASPLECRLVHPIERFGQAVFAHEAGESTRFILQADSPRMKSGKASLSAKPPPWLKARAANLGVVNVTQGNEPIVASQRLAERMLARLSQGLNLQFTRKPWYGDSRSIEVTLSSISFGKSHREYLECLQQLLPMSFRKVEKNTLNYSNIDETLSEETIARLDKIVEYTKVDQTVKAFYIDGHTDSQGVRTENLTLSEQRARLVQTYLIEQGIAPELIVLRWHGERYPVATNQSDLGMAKNRRVTVRLSKEPVAKADVMAGNMPKNPTKAPSNKQSSNQGKNTAKATDSKANPKPDNPASNKPGDPAS